MSVNTFPELANGQCPERISDMVPPGSLEENYSFSLGDYFLDKNLEESDYLNSKLPDKISSYM